MSVGKRVLAWARWALLVLVLLTAAGLGFVADGRVGAQDGSSTPPDREAAVEPLPPCPPPGPYDGSSPPHPYEPGDPICSAEGTGVLRAGVPSSNGIPALDVMQKNVAVWTHDPGLAGIYVSRTVSNPIVGADDTQYHTMHAGGTGGNWIEIGWEKLGGGTREIFVATNGGHWGYASEYPISTGQTIKVQLDNYAGNNNWNAKLYWNGLWRALKTINIGTMVATDENVIVESFSNDSSWPTLPQTWVQETKLYLCVFGCSWVNWNTSIGTDTWGDPPYHAHFTYYYYKWYAHRH